MGCGTFAEQSCAVVQRRFPGYVASISDSTACEEDGDSA